MSNSQFLIRERYKSIEDKWYYFLKHADESNDIDEILANHPEIKEAYDVLDRYHWSEEELQYYEKLIMSEADVYGTLEAAKKEGREQGRQEERQQIAKSLLKQGLDPGQISQATALSEEEILSFQN